MTTPDAVFSPDGRHRLWLHRDRSDMLTANIYGRTLFFMLNPSKAGATESDMTLSKCLGFSKALGSVRAGVVNAFTRVATDPNALLHESDLNAETANETLLMALAWLQDGPGPRGGKLIFAYGKPAWYTTATTGPKATLSYLFRERVTFMRLAAAAHGLKPFALGLTVDGWPRHPSRFGYPETNGNLGTYWLTPCPELPLTVDSRS